MSDIGLSFDVPAPRFFTQSQDHFDPANPHTWQQAYYVNDTFWKPGIDAPVFLCVGGEGPPLTGSVVVNSVHCDLAVEWLEETKALMFALEHRYYGCHNMSACPVQSFENPTKSLRYLSSRQAVEDVASFVRQMNIDYSLNQRNRWITWGGSYPGMLAGFSRLKHPELIHASVASSAPVHAKLDMFEYNDAVSNAYTVADNNVGGSVECKNAIRDAHQAIEDMLRAGGQGVADVEKMFDIPAGALQSRDVQREYFGSGAAYFPAQSNDPTCSEPACNIAKICGIMVDSSIGTDLQRLVVLRKAQNGAVSKTTSRIASGESLPDFWGYQTCTEFGFYQTCEVNSSCMFVKGLVDVESMVADVGCADYGLTIADIAERIEATNTHYGGLAPSGPTGKLGSCVLWVNGEVDPWATLGILESPGKAQPTLWVEGASHHAWTHPAEFTDQPSVVQAREAIRSQVLAFLSQDCTETRSLFV
jgi:hypothetical protein